MRINTNDKDMYLVAMYDEVPILTNVLRALAKFKRAAGGWPKQVGVRAGNRLPFGFGDDTAIVETEWMLLGALYMSTYDPYLDAPVDRQLTPTKFGGDRVAAESTKYNIFRSRHSA